MGLIDNDSLGKLSLDICKVILDSVKTNIPKGSVKRLRPYWTKDIEKTVLHVVKRKGKKMKKNPQQPANRNNYNRFTAKLRYLRLKKYLN